MARFNGRQFKRLVEGLSRQILREWENYNLTAPWPSGRVSKEEVGTAIDNEDRVIIDYTTEKKGYHQRSFVPTSVMYSDVKDRYRILGVDPNKFDKDGRVSFIVDKIEDWHNIDDEDRRRQNK